MLHPLTEALWRHSWQGSAIAVFVLLLRALPGRVLNAQWRNGLWLLVLARLILPVVPQSQFSVLALVESVKPTPPPLVLIDANQTHAVATVEYGSIENKIAPQHPRITEPQSPSTEKTAVLASIWLFGVMIALLRLVIPNARFAARLRENSQAAPRHLESIKDQCCRQMRLTYPPNLAVTAVVDSPTVFGMLRPRILIPPQSIHTLSDSQFRFVFLHELAHIKCRDGAMDWVWAILQCLHWFNPVLWWITPIRLADREQARDEIALRLAGTEQAAAYGQTLLHLATRSAAPMFRPGLIGILGQRNRLRRRIERILSIGNPRLAAPCLGAALVIAGGCCALTDPRRPVQPSVTRPATTAHADRGIPNSETNLETCSYDVKDLLFKPVDYYPGTITKPPDAADNEHTRVQRIEDLKTFVRENAAVSGQGGAAGSIEADATGTMLVVTDTHEHQFEIQSALQSLRNSMGDQISIESRFFTFNETDIRHLPRPVQQRFAALSGAGKDRTDQLLTADEVNQMIRAVQKQATCAQLTAPRMTAFEGQHCVVRLVTQQSYVSSLTPIIGLKAVHYEPRVSTIDALGIDLRYCARHSPDDQVVSVDTQATMSRLLGLISVTLDWPDPRLKVSGTYQIPVTVKYERSVICSVPDKMTLLLSMTPAFEAAGGSMTLKPTASEAIQTAIDKERQTRVYLLIKPKILKRADLMIKTKLG